MLCSRRARCREGPGRRRRTQRKAHLRQQQQHAAAAAAAARRQQQPLLQEPDQNTALTACTCRRQASDQTNVSARATRFRLFCELPSGKKAAKAEASVRALATSRAAFSFCVPHEVERWHEQTVSGHLLIFTPPPPQPPTTPTHPCPPPPPHSRTHHCAPRHDDRPREAHPPRHTRCGPFLFS